MSGSRKELVRIILGKIREDPLAADLRWSLFVAALQSYRCDTVLRPFPPRFVDDNEEKEIENLREAASGIPSVLHISLKLTSISDVALELLAWVLDDPTFRLCTKDKAEYSKIKKLTGHTTAVPDPSFIFEVEYGDNAERKFETLRNGRKLLCAYHGSRVENFHSILHNGLASHMNKISLFGTGTYLSSELAVSMIYSPGGKGWNKSQLGPTLGCVAVCQIIDDVSVKCTLKEGAGSEAQAEDSRSRARAPESQAGDVPERYYVVQNNEMVRIKYLLLYSQKALGDVDRSAQGVSWYKKNKFAVMMVVYMLLLLGIGLFNSKTFQNFLRKGMKSHGFSSK